MHVITIAGCSGSGKTTLANRLAQRLADHNPLLLAVDAYYRDYGALSFTEREKLNFDHPDAIESELLIAHLRSLLAGNPIKVPLYDFKTHSRRADTDTVHPSRIIIIEGIYALYWPEIRAVSQERIFVDTPLSICFERRLIRDQNERQRTEESITSQWQDTVEPMFRQHALGTREFATLHIEEGKDFETAEQRIIDRLPFICSV